MNDSDIIIPDESLIPIFVSNFLNFILFCPFALFFFIFAKKFGDTIFKKDSSYNSKVVKYVEGIYSMFGIIVICIQFFQGFFVFSVLIMCVILFIPKNLFFFILPVSFANILFFLGMEIQKIANSLTILFFLIISVIYTYLLKMDVADDIEHLENIIEGKKIEISHANEQSLLSLQKSLLKFTIWFKNPFKSSSPPSEAAEEAPHSEEEVDAERKTYANSNVNFLSGIWVKMRMGFLTFFSFFFSLCASVEPLMRLVPAFLPVNLALTKRVILAMDIVCTAVLFFANAGFLVIIFLVLFFILQYLKIFNIGAVKKKEVSQIEELKIEALEKQKQAKEIALVSVLPIAIGVFMLILINLIASLHVFVQKCEYFIGFADQKIIVMMIFITIIITNYKRSKNREKFLKISNKESIVGISQNNEIEEEMEKEIKKQEEIEKIKKEEDVKPPEAKTEAKTEAKPEIKEEIKKVEEIKK